MKTWVGGPRLIAAIALVLASLTLLSCDAPGESPDFDDESMFSPPPGASQPAGCDTNSHTVEHKSLLGFTLWTFTSATQWCWDGTEITAEPHFITDIEVSWPFWSYEGNTEQFELGGEGERYHSDSAMAEFKLCIVRCIEKGYADITKSQYGNGDRTIHTGETSASFDLGLVVVVLTVVFSALLLVTGRRALRRNAGPAWHAVRMTEVVVGLLAGSYAILLFLSLPAW